MKLSFDEFQVLRMSDNTFKVFLCKDGVKAFECPLNYCYVSDTISIKGIEILMEMKESS